MSRRNRFGIKGLFLNADGTYGIDLRGYNINGKTQMRKRVRLPRGLSEADAITYARDYLGRFQLSLIQPRGPRGKGNVYFIAVGEFVKVGFTTSALEVRMRAVDTHSPIAPRLLAAIDGTHATEREWHARLAEHRVRREWFRLAPCIDVLRDALGVVVKEAAE
jgi:hypothetical protein